MNIISLIKNNVKNRRKTFLLSMFYFVTASSGSNTPPDTQPEKAEQSSPMSLHSDTCSTMSADSSRSRTFSHGSAAGYGFPQTLQSGMKWKKAHIQQVKISTPYTVEPHLS